jgi:hypothetical protein
MFHILYSIYYFKTLHNAASGHSRTQRLGEACLGTEDGWFVYKVLTSNPNPVRSGLRMRRLMRLFSSLVKSIVEMTF